MSKHEDSVAQKIIDRAAHGLNKYGVTMERTDLTEREWLVHAQEEAMDLAVYLERLISDLDKKQPKKKGCIDWTDRFQEGCSEETLQKLQIMRREYLAPELTKTQKWCLNFVRRVY